MDQKLQDSLNQVSSKLAEQCLQMVVEESEYHLVGHFMYLLVAGELLIVTDTHCGEDKLAQLCEDSIVVILTYRKVHIVASNHILVKQADLPHVLPLSFV